MTFFHPFPRGRAPPLSGHGGAEPEPGGAAECPGADGGEHPAGAGDLPLPSALPAAAPGREDLRADRAAGHACQAHREQLGHRRCIYEEIEYMIHTETPLPPSNTREKAEGIARMSVIFYH